MTICIFSFVLGQSWDKISWDKFGPGLSQTMPGFYTIENQDFFQKICHFKKQPKNKHEF